VGKSTYSKDFWGSFLFSILTKIKLQIMSYKMIMDSFNEVHMQGGWYSLKIHWFYFIYDFDDNFELNEVR